MAVSHPPASAGKPAAKSTAESVKDTLESIVVAFILAFVFRAFIVEAFVIPTGSMAVTLYGDQATNTCSICGFEYARGIDQFTAAVVRSRGGEGIRLQCPNCSATPDVVPIERIARPDSGDRILVHKWPLDVGSERLGPHRWDVTVFKDPKDGTTNFIKRLIGLPGEVLEIIDGDIYAAPIETLKAKGFPVEKLDELRRQVYDYAHADAGSAGALRESYADLNKRLLPFLKIQRKTERAQSSLWSNVYDHDFLPNYGSLPVRSSSGEVGWKPDDGPAAAAWNTAQREVTFASESREPLFVRFSGKKIDDYSAYNADGREGAHGFVGDVRLRFTWFPDAGAGGIVLRTNRDENVFTSELKTDGSITVTGRGPNVAGGLTTIGTRQLKPFASGEAVEVEWVNVDYQVRLLVGGEVLIASTDEQYQPDVVRSLARKKNGWYSVKETEVRIGASNMRCRLRHLLLERDVYYIDAVQRTEESSKRNPYDGLPGWGTAGMPILLRPERTVDGQVLGGEYFMLGDNSAASKDSRLWWEIGPHLTRLGSEYQVGTVTGDQLLGKAFFVYWPAGYRPAWAGGIGLIPNVGRMRWIR